MLLIVALVLAYLLGSVSFAIVVSRLMGLHDPRRYGSGNPGATNVLRSGNKVAAVLTLLGDACKGAVAVGAAKVLFLQHDVLPLPPLENIGLVCGVALAVFAGHLWPVFFRFRGGKGVATALGVLLALSPWLGLASLLTWLSVALLCRISSLAALTAAVLAPGYAVVFLHDWHYTATTMLIAVLLIWRHKKNIVGLLRGTESRIGAGKKA